MRRRDGLPGERPARHRDEIGDRMGEQEPDQFAADVAGAVEYGSLDRSRVHR